MRCPQCDTENREGARFCRKCAANLTLRCPQCGTELPLDATFCDACAAPLQAAPRAAPETPVLSAAEAIPERVQRLIPKEFAERLLATRGEVQPERRTVTILFSDVKGSTAMAEHLDPEDVMEIMDGAFDVLIEPIYRYEGTLARLMGDAVLAFFGAPIAHEDDPERACRAALEITAGAAEYAEKLEQERGIKGFSVRVGINTGLVVVGEVGSDLRVEYTAMGDAINLAARMEQSAPPGGILITHDTYRHVRGVFDVRQQELLTVKGKRELVQTYLVLRAKPRPFRKPMRGVEGIETRMIGRQAELNRLQEAFYTAMEDCELQMATIIGDAGVGKSRLLHEFDIWAEALAEQYFFFKARSLQEMQSLPYSLIRDLFAFRFQIEDTDPLPVVRKKLERGISVALGAGEDSRMRAHFIGHLVGFEFGPSSHLEGVLDEPKQIRDRALTYLADYFKALASQGPVLILLEDLHWADDSSLDALNHLALALVGQPVMIVGAARPALFDRRPHWGEGQAFHRRLPLEPLSKRNTRRLLDEILQKVEHVPDTLSELVVAGAEGNPFFVEELVKMLVEDGVIAKGQEEWRVELSRLIEVSVPSTLRGVLQARLDRLPVQDRSILQQASVVGRLFWDRAVVRITESAASGVEQAEVLNILSALRGREMVFQRETSAFAGAQEYIFKHAVLREVTYESLLKRLRRAYHGLVADWLMEQGGERVGEYTGLIADHLELAGRTVEATDYLLEAGDRARGLYAHQEAIGAYQRALSLLREQGDYERAARTLMKLGLTYHTAFEFQRSREAYEEGFAMWQRAAEAQAPVSLPPAPHAFRAPWQEPLSLDPTMADDVYSEAVIDQLFSALVELTPEMNVVPDVAQSWEVLEGGRKYRFRLRDDVRWSDGTPVTAEDFEYSLKRILNPANGSPLARMLLDIKGAAALGRSQVADTDSLGIHATSETTLVLELEEPIGYFMHLLTHGYAVPRHVVEAHGESWANETNIVTNGPFRLDAWRHGELLVLSRNPGYHGRRKGNLVRKDLDLREYADGGLALYEANKWDAMPLSAEPEVRGQLRRRHAEEYLSIPILNTRFIAFDVTRPPFDDLRVRRALAMAIDRETLCGIVLGGYRFAAGGGFLPIGMAAHSPGIALPCDPTQALELLAEAGYPHGRGFPVVDTLTTEANLPSCTYLTEQWRESLGIELSWRFAASKEVFGRKQRDRPHLILYSWLADYPDPDNYLRVCLANANTGWHNETYEELVEKARHLTDHSTRMKMYGEAHRILIEEAPIIPLDYGRVHLLLKPWVTQFPASAMRYWFWKDVIIEPH